MHILETPRLTLRYFTKADAPFILQLMNSPRWLKYIGDRNVHSIQEAETYLVNGPLRSYEEHGHGLSMVIRKKDDEAVGMCGILHREMLDIPDIGFALLPDYNGMGYAFEIAEATINHARRNWGLTVIGAITLPNNDSSIRVLSKLGFSLKGETVSTSADTQLLYQSAPPSPGRG